MDKEKTLHKLFRNDGQYSGLSNIEFNIKEGDKVLDIGGGNKPFNKATHLIDMIDADKQRHGKGLKIPGHVEFHEGDATVVLEKFPNDYFDFVYMNHVAEHIDNLPKLIDIINLKCRRGFIASPASDFEFFTAAPHYHHVNLLRYINGVLHIAKRPQQTIIKEFAQIYESLWHNNQEFKQLWENTYRHIWECRILWEKPLKYIYYQDPCQLYPQLEFFEKS